MRSPRSTGQQTMRFDHVQQHTSEGLARIEQMARQREISVRQALFIAEELVVHAHPGAMRPVAMLKEKARHRDILAHAGLLQKTFDEVRGHFRLEAARRDHLDLFYRLNGFVHVRNPKPNDTLLVAFTTMFNNFYVSNAAFAAILSGLPCDLLLLKDATLLNYHGGVAGFAPDFPGIAPALERFAASHGKSRVVLTGYSSGGYAALLTSLLMRCDGYLGFSHQVDLADDSVLPSPRLFTDEVRAHVDRAWLRDCRPLLAQANPAVSRTLIYGERSERDAAHARHLGGLDGIRLVELAGAGHNTIQPLLAESRLVALFRDLVTGG